MSKKIIICGGHPSPALAVIEELQKGGSYEIIYIGKTEVNSNYARYSWEYQQIKQLGLKIYQLNTGKFHRIVHFSSFTSLLRIPLGILKALFILKKEKPDIVLSFGGYIGLPVVICAKLFHIPIVSHEQTAKTGLSNKIIAHFADTICISWQENYNQLNHKRIIYTGNPIRGIIKKSAESQLSNLISEKLPIIYITGGGLGSHFINELAGDKIDELIQRYIIIHQCGNALDYDDYHNLEAIKSKLPQKLKSRYLLYEHLDGKDVSWVLHNASLLIGRSGANTITEILYIHIPALLIPLPWSGEGEQDQNAQMLAKLGVARMVNQKDIDGDKLLKQINEMLININVYKESFNSNTDQLVSMPSANLIVQELERLLRERQSES